MRENNQWIRPSLVIFFAQNGKSTRSKLVGENIKSAYNNRKNT